MIVAVRALVLVTALLVGAAAGAVAQPAPVTVPTAGGDVTVLADRLEELGRDNVVVATGNVELVRGRARLNADRVEINRDTGDAVATGRVVFYDGEDRLTGDRIDYNIKTGTGVVHHGRASTAPYYRLGGERMERVGDQVYRVRRGFFTTCEDDPPAWSFRFDEATADLEEHVHGTGASFWVKDIPLIPFFPFFAAAIRRERQTGFLFPVFGTSGRRGFYTEIPFFWAIDESQDLTVSFNAYELKGVGGRALYRYKLAEDHGGSVGGFWVHESAVDGKDRGWGSVKHEWRGPSSWRVVVDANMVSDDDVLRDYSLRLADRSLQRVETNAFVAKPFENWNFVGNVFSYQDLTTSRPTELRRLPELRVDRIRSPVPGLPGVQFDLESSATYFQRVAGSEGARVDVHPRLSAPWRAFDLVTVTPYLGGRLTGYDHSVTSRRLSADLAHQVDIVNDDPRLRRLLESGVDLEMPLSRVYSFDRWGVDAILHRIEPRVSYAFITGGGLNHLPIYTDRVDRIKETSEFTYSVTNRILAKTTSTPDTEAVRWEAVRLLLGHSIDLRSRNQSIGDLIGDLIVQAPSIFRFRSEARYGMEPGELVTATTDVSATTGRFAASVGTRFDREQRTNFLQGSLRMELTDHVVGRLGTNWDMRSDTFVENQYGVDLRFQCWEVSIVFIDRNREARRRGADEEVRFTVNLLGIGTPLRTSVGP